MALRSTTRGDKTSPEIPQKHWPLSVTMTLYLDPIPKAQRSIARQRLYAGDICGFLALASNEAHLELVIHNQTMLDESGLFEQSLLCAWTSTRTNHAKYTLEDLWELFDSCDRDALAAAADELPAGEYFTVYRGVAGQGKARRVEGLSWSGSLKKAQWFANRFPHFAHPAVYVVRVARADVLAYINERNEQEFICDLRAACYRPSLLKRTRQRPNGGR